MSAAVSNCSPLDYEAALGMLSSLIVWRKGDTFHLMFDYLKILELDEFISELKVIHVAGTKGKGSTCAFAESILRNCGFRTGLLTSPHLIDVRERICLDGVKVSKDKFSSYFLWCWNRLKEKTGDIPMPDFFHFLTLLGLKIFIAEKVDVAILEVSLGGRLDSTNVVQQPIVCGISSLGYDHMEILGYTLAKIAEEKAGIFKNGVPAFTVAQPDEAMYVLEDRASQLSGSTCTFVESILRNCGFRTGLFTSPHLIDVRERFRLDSVEISEEKFFTYFWWCWNKLKVDVAILEVGLGGKFDATNVVKRAVVCGISSLGYDHMEILGHTLGKIAGEKAGIFKHGVPAFTVEQSDEAMSVLIDKASQLSVPLQVSQPLDSSLLNGFNLGLDGNHQYPMQGLQLRCVVRGF